MPLPPAFAAGVYTCLQDIVPEQKVLCAACF